MRALKALIALAMLAGTLLVAPAADAGVESDEVDVIRRANGILDIIGDNRDNDVAICQINEPEPDAAADGHGYDYVVVIEDDLGTHYVYVEDITKDIRFNMRGGDDNVRINGSGGSCDDAIDDGAVAGDPGYFHVARDLRITLGGGNDTVTAYDYWVYDDMTIVGGAGFEEINLLYGHVNDRMDVNAGPGGSFTVIDEFYNGTTSFRGGSLEDVVILVDGDAGRAPRFLTAAGEDALLAIHVDAVGRVLANLGAGDDYLNWYDEPDDGGCSGAACDEHEQEFFFNIIMGSGNDQTHMNIPLIPQDRLNGGSGNEDYLGFVEPLDVNAELFGGATINGYEFFGPPELPF